MICLKKGHRTPPNIVGQGEDFSKQDGPKPGTPGWHEPYMEGFDGAAWEQSVSCISAEAIRYDLFYKYQDEMDPEVLAYWEKHGVRKEMFDRDREGGIHRYSIHTPIDMDVNKGYPMIYFCHGGMQDPFQAECNGFSSLVKTEQVIVVYAHNGGPSNEDCIEDFKSITDAIKEKKYPVDWSRVYVAGFSSGSDATESIATQWPEMIAAVAPCPGSNAMYNSLCRLDAQVYQKCLKSRLPIIFVGGTADTGDRYPYPDAECIENFNIWAKEIAQAVNYKEISFEESKRLAAESEDATKRAVGLDFEKTWTEHFEERDWYFGEYYGEGHIPVIRFIVGEGVPHVVTGSYAGLIWEFFKHWSKNPETGESIYMREP